MPDMKQTVREWLESGKVEIFLGYKSLDGHPLPCAFTKENLAELDDLMVSPARYPLEKLAAGIIAAKPSVKIGILGRNCNRRALNVLAVHQQIAPDQIELLEMSCCPSLSQQTSCSNLQPQTNGFVKRQLGIDNYLRVDEVEEYPPEIRYSRWMYEFQKCLKCYGCRDICPVCFCKECALEHDELVETGGLPPEVPLFHLIRAVHMAGRCVDCGLCEEACPVDIPLRLLYRKANDVVKDLFGYETGLNQDQSPFSLLGGSAPREPEAQAAG